MSFNMDFKINLWTILLVAVGIFFLINRSNLKDDVERWTNNYNTLNSEHVEYVSQHDDMVIYKDGIIELTKKELKSALKSDSIQRELAKKYKAEAAVVKIETVTEIKEVLVPFPVYVDKDTSVNVTNPCFTVDISATNGLLTLSDLIVENRQDIVLGKRKTGLWKTEQAFDIRNTNPCIRTVGATAYTVVVDNKWHQKWWITVPVSFGTGYLVGQLNR